MARADVTPQLTSSAAALTPTFDVAVVDGHMWQDNGRMKLRVKNTNAAPRTVTVLIPGTIDGVAVVNGGKQHTVPATTGDVIIGPFPAAYRQANGKVYVDYSDPADVSIAVIEDAPV
ncbi:MAG: hypothetical protein ACRDT8_00220 [Micromonosporaceae bacterium]